MDESVSPIRIVNYSLFHEIFNLPLSTDAGIEPENGQTSTGYPGVMLNTEPVLFLLFNFLLAKRGEKE